MSITVNIYYTGKNGSALKFAEEMESSGTAELIRNEDGNEKYEYFQSLEDKETVLLIDSWRDSEAIDRHHLTPMMQKITELREKYDLHMRVERYIPDENGVPRSDREYIRE
ncbi:MAG: antibiotic biosynthesis monooxygenase [Oscillospiraceae bacterium]|nr:antibiotic biosynthesis monooxygenase [Oscillospiraceae bacterium]